METFALAAVSLTISISLLIKRKKDPLHRSYALLCLALALAKFSLFFHQAVGHELLRMGHIAGMIVLCPLLVAFARRLMAGGETLLTESTPWYTVAGGVIVAAVVFSFKDNEVLVRIMLYAYLMVVMAWCFAALLISVLQGDGIRKKRLSYVAIAVTVAVLFSVSDVLRQFGFATPILSEIAFAVLIYFVLIVIVYPKLPEFYEILARALIIFVLVLFVTGVFYAVVQAFGRGSALPDLKLVLMASFMVVIFIDPVKLLLKRTVSHLFFEGRTAFTSLFALDDEMEREKSAFLEEMARGLAHEIRNPLGSIKGAAQYLKSESGSPETEQLLEVIAEEVDRLERVVSRFLSFANPYTVNLVPRDINTLVERALELIRRDKLPKDISIETNLSQDLPPVEIDEEKFMQVVFNLVLNALEAMPDGGTLTLSSSLLEDERMRAVKLTVEDTGVGIRKEHMKQLFKPFFTTKKEGTGLGLAICRKIVGEHGGYIRVSSQSGKGTRFHVVLPVE